MIKMSLEELNSVIDEERLRKMVEMYHPPLIISADNPIIHLDLFDIETEENISVFFNCYGNYTDPERSLNTIFKQIECYFNASALILLSKRYNKSIKKEKEKMITEKELEEIKMSINIAMIFKKIILTNLDALSSELEKVSALIEKKIHNKNFITNY